MDLDPNAIRDGLLTFILLLASLCIHEWAHAFVADVLGDDTPRLQGRVTLNPLVHIDVIGTIVMPLVSIFCFGGNFAYVAWAKPVMVNASNFRHPRRDDVLVTAAGPASNALIALLAVVAGSFLVIAHPILAELINRFVMMNVGLTVFNLLPIPPLDGGILFSHAVRMSTETFTTISNYSGFFVLAALAIPQVRLVLAILVVYASLPYRQLCWAIDPRALMLIFPL